MGDDQEEPFMENVGILSRAPLLRVLVMISGALWAPGVWGAALNYKLS